MTIPKEQDIQYTNTKHISCKGLNAPYDHPLIYLEIKNIEDSTKCPYCNRMFIYKNQKEFNEST